MEDNAYFVLHTLTLRHKDNVKMIPMCHADKWRKFGMSKALLELRDCLFKTKAHFVNSWQFLASVRTVMGFNYATEKVFNNFSFS